MKTYYYEKTTDDVVNSAQQDFALPDDYQILPTSLPSRIWNKIARILATGFGWIYSRGFLHVHVVGKEKLQQIHNQGYFVYGNHTQPMGDVFTPLTVFPIKNFYAIAGQANWGIPFIGKHLVRYGGLPVGNDIKQSIKLIKAIQTIISDKKGVVLIYPEAHVWPYYTQIRPFDETSMHFPVSLNAPSFTATSTYRKSKLFKRPKITVYIDGPFYPNKNLSKKQAQKNLYEQIWKSLTSRAKLSNYNYYNYEKTTRNKK
ncbi:1-acyl-sn-glycerol-3-phosphate acyltransferase [Lactobacillus hamsteri]|uniref:1-acyl-sn-glycerol-3-phosphate acyltransferase n=1 Tax=Lactobacillus hamsteri DSM 5661 = JCM 6256 TaxID=1423754 RepID=A0A0R1YAN5_9LACO|nr:lysophospholipid acyltransferase family protein [Lactobacillus hamsteri]KRM39623.1 1-acyl-sn-glycerol-3-phosphate acyltransferase [Lactobacillus hamsteri DSM 5661 = JCM 6256]